MIGEISGWTPQRIEALLEEQSGYPSFPMLAIILIVVDIEGQLVAANERIAVLEAALQPFADYWYEEGAPVPDFPEYGRADYLLRRRPQETQP